MVDKASEPHLSVTENVVLALLVEHPRHGFAIAKELAAGTDLGQILSVHRPVVYRALDRLRASDLIRSGPSEPGAAGPNRTLHHPTDQGHLVVRRWLARPVEHVRDLRIEFLLKLRLNQRLGSSLDELVASQRTALAPTLDGLAGSTADHVADRWRRHNAIAARNFLDDLA